MDKKFLPRRRLESMKIRALTIGSCLNNSSELVPLIEKSRQLQKYFQQKGFEVQTVRIALNSQNDLGVICKLGEICQKEKFDFLSLGPIDISLSEEIPQLLNKYKSLSCTLDLTRTDDSFEPAARIMLDGSKLDPQMNFRFAAVVNVGPDTPFFPAGFHLSSAPSLSIGLQDVQELIEVSKEKSSLPVLRDKLLTKLTEICKEVERVSFEAAKNYNLFYAGIDTSPAPLGTESLATLIENISGNRFGTEGTKEVCKYLTEILKSVPVQKVGYCGLMLAVLEDSILGQRNDERLYTINEVLEYSTVCGTGLDTIPIPGNTTVDQIVNILKKVKKLSIDCNSKPLSARLFPLPGKLVGDMTDFNSPYLFNTNVMSVEEF